MLSYDNILNITKYLDLPSFISLCLCNREYSYLLHDTFILKYWKSLFNKYSLPELCSYQHLLGLYYGYIVPPPLYRSYPTSHLLYINKDRSSTNIPLHIGTLGSFIADRAEENWLNFIVVKTYSPGDDYLEVIYPVFYEQHNTYILGSDLTPIKTSDYDPVYKYLSHNSSCQEVASNSLQCQCGTIQQYRYPSFKYPPFDNLYKICRINMKCEKMYTTYISVSNHIQSPPHKDIGTCILTDNLYNC